MSNFYALSATNSLGEEILFEKLRGKVVIIVNVASLCGFTPQYSDLERLYQKYHHQGLEILAFPCNQFGGQEPQDGISIERSVRKKFGVTFPILAKGFVNGDDTHPVYRYLKEKQRAPFGFKGVRWNFEKFIIDRQGHPVYRYGASVNPLELEPLIVELLQQNPSLHSLDK